MSLARPAMHYLLLIEEKSVLVPRADEGNGVNLLALGGHHHQNVRDHLSAGHAARHKVPHGPQPPADSSAPGGGGLVMVEHVATAEDWRIGENCSMNQFV